MANDQRPAFMPAPANDNYRGTTVRSPEDHRNATAALDKGEAVGPRDPWPLLTALRRRDPRLGDAIEAYEAATRPTSLQAANDNRPTVESKGFQIDSRSEIVPSPLQLYALSDRASYSSASGDLPAGSVARIAVHIPASHSEDGNLVTVEHEGVGLQRLGGLIFDSRNRLRFHQSDGGRWYWFLDDENFKEAKGSRSGSDEASDKVNPANIGPGKRNGVPIAANDNTSMSVLEAERSADMATLRRGLGGHAVTLDAAIECDTAREVGERFGHSGKYAERTGMKRVVAALEEFLAIAA